MYLFRGSIQGINKPKTFGILPSCIWWFFLVVNMNMKWNFSDRLTEWSWGDCVTLLRYLTVHYHTVKMTSNSMNLQRFPQPSPRSNLSWTPTNHHAWISWNPGAGPIIMLESLGIWPDVAVGLTCWLDWKASLTLSVSALLSPTVCSLLTVSLLPWWQTDAPNILNSFIRPNHLVMRSSSDGFADG